MTQNYAIFPSKPTISTTTVKKDTDGSLTYPSGCIWFKPIGGGNVTLAFTKQSNGNTYEYMSIYRYKRNPNTGILDTSVPVKEIIVAMSKNGLGTGAISYYNLYISDIEAQAGYEYVIGRSSNASSKTTAGFVYLKLAGVNITGGEGATAPDGRPYRLLKDIDFVESNEVDLTSDTWQMHKSILTLSNTHSHDTGGYAAIYYDVGTVTVSGKNVEGVVYKNDTGLTVKQVIQTDPEAANNTSFTYGPYETRKPITGTG